MSVVRAFIAIELSPEIYQRLDEITRQLRERLAGVPIRWVPTRNIHITLKFLGDVSLSNLDIVKKIIRVQAESHACFEMRVGSLGAFPSINRARVIWVGVDAPAVLKSIHHGIDVETARLGYDQEDRAFSPHLTLGRVGRNANSQDTHKIGQVLSMFEVGALGQTRVQNIHLFRSDLQPSGAVYSPLYSAPLHGHLAV